MSGHWRPSLGFVLGGALGGTLVVSFAGLVALRYLGPVIGFRNAAILLALSITMVTAVLGWLLVRLLLRPIRALEAYAEAQEQGGTPAPPRHFGTHELHATARRVIAMAETLRDREATIRAFTDQVTHELRTPVTAIRAASELLEDGGALGREDAALVAQVDGACTQIERQLAALRGAARARETRYLGTSTLDDLRTGLREDHPDLALQVEGGSVPLPIAGAGMKIVLGQLLRNAGEHGACQVLLRAGSEDGAPFLQVQDDGTGISPGNAARVFDPFFTTRRGEGGTGMGLAIVRNLLTAHGAGIRLLPAERGTRLGIRFASAER